MGRRYPKTRMLCEESRRAASTGDAPRSFVGLLGLETMKILLVGPRPAKHDGFTGQNSWYGCVGVPERSHL